MNIKKSESQIYKAHEDNVAGWMDGGQRSRRRIASCRPPNANHLAGCVFDQVKQWHDEVDNNIEVSVRDSFHKSST